MKLRLLLFSIALLCSIGASADTVSFVQITDPHIFDCKGDVEGNKEALKWCITQINGRLGPSADYKFIVVTGDLGLEGLPCAANETEPAPAVGDKAKELADIIKVSKVKQWLFLPGNNDLVGEDPEKIGTFHRFIDALKEKAPEMQIVDFCPRDGDNQSGILDVGGCRFIGFNNASFKSNDLAKNAETFELKQIANVDEVLARLADPRFKSAYVFYHIPEIDDPYCISLDPTKPADNEILKKRDTSRGEIGKEFPCSAWTVTRKVRDKWDQVVANDRVKGLFAGHFHSADEGSYTGLGWIRSAGYPAGSTLKLQVCPPLASKKQENKPTQARGFREVSVDCEKDEKKSEVVWYRKGGGEKFKVVEKDLVLWVEPGNTASGLIHFSNPTEKEISLSLSAEDFKSGNYGLNTKVLFALASASTPGQQVLETKVAPGATIAVKIDVSNFWEAGEATANLCNFGEPIGKIRAAKWRPSFAVKIVSATPDKPELTFTKGKPPQIILKNEDAMTYPVLVSAEVNGIQAPSSEVVLPPSSSVPVELKTRADWFPFSASVKEIVRDGTIRITWKPANAGNQPLPERVIPFKAHLNYIGEFGQSFWGYGFVLVFVTMGGLCSLLLNNWVPNALNRADIQEQLGALANRTRDLSTHIDSRLRVLLRVERNRVAQLLKSHLIISAEFADVVKQSRDKIAMLNQQIDVAAQLDRARLDLEHAIRTNALAAIVDEADTELQKAADLLQRADPTKEEFDGAKALIVSATQRIGKMTELDTDFESKLRKKIESLNQEFYPTSATVSEALSKLKTALGRVFTSFDKFRSATPPLSSSDYWLVDLITEQLGLVRLYQAYYDSTKTPPFPKQDDYVRLLQTDTIAGLRKAKLLLQQIKEVIFVEDIVAAIKDPCTKIVIEPSPMEDRLAKFSVRFSRAELNSAAARDEIPCEWDFGHNDLTETGWEAYHYFPRGGEPKYTVKATFLPPNAKAGDEPLSISTIAKVETEPRSVIGDRNLAEGLRLAIVLVIALIGLLAGAREQLTKLDLIPAAIAVFLLGFAADTIKNLITPKQAQK